MYVYHIHVYYVSHCTNLFFFVFLILLYLY